MITTMMKRLAQGARFARVRAAIADFRLNKRGNVAVITALAALPMVAAVGCAIDYTDASMIKTKLQAAADAASLATVSYNSPVISTAQNMSGSGAISGGSTDAVNYFNANLTQSPEDTGYTSLTSSATVTKSGQVLTATVSYTAKVSTYFMGVMGYNTLSISGTSSASYTLPTYINFYLMIDVSGSMSFPATSAEQERLQAVNPDNYSLYPNGCTFACHFTSQGACSQSEQESGVPPSAYTNQYNPSPGGYCQGFTITRLGTTPAACTSPTVCTNITPSDINWGNSQVSSCSTAGTTSCIELRADAVGYAVTQLLSTAASSEIVTHQFEVGLYPFIVDLYSYFPLTNNLTATGSGSINAAATQLASLLDTGVNSNLGSGGTHFENAFPSMNSLISTVGTGSSSSNALPYVFLITDGSQDCQTQSGGNWSGDAGCNPYYNSATTIDTSLCTTLKNRGITIAVLYIPYEKIQNPTTFANSEDIYANDNIPNIPGALQSCASTNFYYTATTPADINNALVTMFEQAVSTAHITN
jgi:Flp pilus assembly protein TadG